MSRQLPRIHEATPPNVRCHVIARDWLAWREGSGTRLTGTGTWRTRCLWNEQRGCSWSSGHCTSSAEGGKVMKEGWSVLSEFYGGKTHLGTGHIALVEVHPPLIVVLAWR